MQIVDDEKYKNMYFELIINYRNIFKRNITNLRNIDILENVITKYISTDDEKKERFINRYKDFAFIDLLFA